jgi:DNA-binding transcriptional regulator YdaS (Cro superfamily)
VRRIVLLPFFLAITVGVAAAQALTGEQVLTRLGLTDSQINQLSSIQQQTQAEVRPALADLSAAKSRLSNLLLNPNADPKEVERLVRAAADAETKIRLAVIRREMAIRKVIGDVKWQRLILFLRVRLELLANGTQNQGIAGAGSADAAADSQGRSNTSQEERVQALLRDLLDVMGETSSPAQ